MSSNKVTRPLKKEQVASGFQELRQQQRVIASRLAEIESDLREHELVIGTLSSVDAGRRCYRLVGGVLVEKTAGGVLPTLSTNKEHLNQLMLMLQKQLEEKGREVNAYRAEHNIKIKGEGECGTGLSDSKPAGGGGVLVANTRS